MRAKSVMHQDFVARIEEAEELAARCTNEKDRVGWLKVADNYRKQLDRLEPVVGTGGSDQTRGIPQPPRRLTRPRLGGYSRALPMFAAIAEARRPFL